MKKSEFNLLSDLLGEAGATKLEKAIFKEKNKSVVDPSEQLLGLITVPRAILSWLVQNIKPLKIGEHKEMKFPGQEDTIINVQKQDIDTYRAEFVRHGAVIHRFDSQSLPAVGSHLMTTFEHYDHLNEADKIVEDKKEMIDEHEKLIDKLKKPKKKELEEEAKEQESELEEYKSGAKDLPKNSSSLVTTIMNMNDINIQTSDPEAVKWMSNHANVKAFTDVIGKLVDALVTKHKSKTDLADAMGKIGKEEIKPDMKVKESRTPEEINKEHEKKLKQAADLEGMGINEIHQESNEAQEEGRADPKIANQEDLSEKGIGEVEKGKSIKKDEIPTQKRDLKNWHRKQLESKVEMKPSGSGIEPLAKPFVSDSQRRWGHTEAGKKALGGEKAVAHWDATTKGKDLPEKVAKEAPKEDEGLSCPSCGTITKDGDKCSECAAGAAEHAMEAWREEGRTPKGGSARFRQHFANKSAQWPKARGAWTAKAEASAGAAVPRGPQPPQPPKPPVGPSHNPQAASAKQSQAAAKGKIALPKPPVPAATPKLTTGLVKPIAPMSKPGAPGANKFPAAPKMGKSEGFHITERELFTKCEHCGKAEFKKSESGPEFDPCSCFSIVRKNEEGQHTTFVKLSKVENGYKLSFAKNADPDSAKAFLLLLKSHLLLKKMGA